VQVTVCDVGPHDGLQEKPGYEPFAAGGLDAVVGVVEWLEGLLGGRLPGQVCSAGTLAPLAG
jgi:hypothetical protein